MATLTEKAVKAKRRYRAVADEYRIWLEKNPKADKDRKMKMFDAIVDSAALDQFLKDQDGGC